MFVQYNNLDIRVSLDGDCFRVLNIARESQRRIIPSHSHGAGSYEIHYIQQGRGQVFIDGTLYPLFPGSLYVAGPHAAHTQIPDRAEAPVDICIYLQTAPDTARSPLTRRFLKTPFWIGEDRQCLNGVMTRLFEELGAQKRGYAVYVEALLTQILVCVLRNYDSRPEPASRCFARASLSDARAFIMEEAFLYEYATLTLEQLAGKLGASVRQTQRMLALYYHKTFREKRNEARMSAAMILLGYTDQPVHIISEELGYAAPEYFTSAFKKCRGMSPLAYRRRQYSRTDFRCEKALAPPEGLKSANIEQP